jgi:hypothetical protein
MFVNSIEDTMNNAYKNDLENAATGARIIDYIVLNSEVAVGLWKREHPYHPFVVWNSYHDGVTGNRVEERGSYYAKFSDAQTDMLKRYNDKRKG